MLFELYLIDLTPEKREEFLKAHGCWDADVEDPSTFPNNWDVFPIMVFDPDEYDSDDVDEFSSIVSVLDAQNNPSDNKEFVFKCYTYENGMHNGYIIVESLEDLAQFIVSNENDKVITDIGDQLIIKTIGSFLDVVPDQQFRLEFMPYLLKAQGYEDIDEEYYEDSDESHHENISNDELKRLHELVSIYLSKAKMDEVLIEIYYDVTSFDDALDIVLEDALYDLNFTEDEAKEFHHLVKIYKKVMKMNKKLHCEHCATPINPNTEVYFESEFGIIFCEECADIFLMFSDDIQAYVHEEEYKEVYFDDDLSDIDPFTKHEPEDVKEVTDRG